MNILTQEEVTNSAIDSWARTYAFGKYQRRPNTPLNWQSKVWENLCSLQNPTKEMIDQAIGNDSWTSLQCDECSEKVVALAVFETSEFPLHLCHDCLVGAANRLVMELVE
jgi:hypothetical protein